MGREWMWYMTLNGIGCKCKGKGNGGKWSFGTENGTGLKMVRDWEGYGGYIWHETGFWDETSYGKRRAMEQDGLWDCFRSSYLMDMGRNICESYLMDMGRNMCEIPYVPYLRF